MKELDTWLETLGLERGATFGDVRAAYRDLAKVWHPDRFPNDERLKARAGEELQAVNDAFTSIERFLEGGGELPKAPSAGRPPGSPMIRKRNPMRDTWTIRPPLRMETAPVPDRRRVRRMVNLVGSLLLLGGVIVLLIWRWPL
jgi:hypothetical protein